MLNTDKWFERVRNDTDRAQSALESKNYAEFHYFAGCIAGDICVIRELAELNVLESTEPKQD